MTTQSDREKAMKQGFDHPCRETCSGWRQGRERGRFDADLEWQTRMSGLEKSFRDRINELKVAGWAAVCGWYEANGQIPHEKYEKMREDGHDWHREYRVFAKDNEEIDGPRPDFSRKALASFKSQQAPDVVVVPKWMQAKVTAEIQHRLKRALEQGSGFTFEQEAHILHGVDMTFEAIKGIGKDV